VKKAQYAVFQESWGRATGALIFAAFLIRQLLPESMGGMYPGLADELIFVRWCLVTFLFALFFHAYLKRTPALSLANRPIEVILPLICAPLPIAMIVLCQLYYQQDNFRELIFEFGLNSLFTPWLEPSNIRVRFGLLVMAIGEVITVAGMWHLRSSFSIFTEARALVRTGLYKYMRHPLYLGEVISVWGYVILLPNTLTVFSATLFTVLQIIRAKEEEKKLSGVHPQYHEYRQSTGFLTPKWGKKKA